MDEWIDVFATALGERLGRAGGQLRIVDDDARKLLDLAGAVAHQTGDRTNAPLSTFLAGWYVGASAGEGVPPGKAIGEAAELASSLLHREA